MRLTVPYIEVVGRARSQGVRLWQRPHRTMVKRWSGLVCVLS